MIVVGVTGKYCSGKNTVTELLVERGYLEIDVDRVGHDALLSEEARVIDEFGAAVRGDDGRIDRKALGGIVFDDRAALARLEAIVHPVMVADVRERIDAVRSAAEPPPGVVINAAILVRMRLDELCDTVIYVRSPFLTRLRRARERDGARLRDVLKRLRSQRDVDPQHSKSHADIQSVQNDDDRKRLLSQLEGFLPIS